MAPMRKPPPDRQRDWQETMSIDAFGRMHGLSRREVRQMLQDGRLAFMQLAGQIRIPNSAQVPRICRPAGKNTSTSD